MNKQTFLALEEAPDYCMYTSFGNDAVHAIVRSAVILKTSWKQVHSELVALTKRFPKDFSEATDTAVREVVYYYISTINKTDEDFYV